MSFQKVCSNLGFAVDLSFGHIQKGGIAVAHLHTRTPRFLASRGKTPETMASSLYRNFNITAKRKDDSNTKHNSKNDSKTKQYFQDDNNKVS